jgi:murein DD-endopeptidase MepM/ murein hydrolase activator NlpD
MADGRVSSVQPSIAGWGAVVTIYHDLPIGKVTSVYAHVNWKAGGPPAVGDTVRRGQELARIGSGGGLYPYHLHFEVRGGNVTRMDRGYMASQSARTPEGQIDPNLFIRAFR